MKTWYLSKVLWVNAIAILGLALQTINKNYIIDPEIQAGILAIINLILRTVTGAPLDWSATPAAGEQPPGPPATAGFIQVPLLFMILSLLAAGIIVNGCSTTNPGAPADWVAPLVSDPSVAKDAPPATKDTPLALAGKFLLSVKSTIVTAASATDAFCRAGKISADKCDQAKVAYELAKPAYDAAVDSYLLMSSQGGDPGDFGRALARVQSIAANLLTLSGSSRLVSGVEP